MHLHHLHLPKSPSYIQVSYLQSLLVRQHLSYKSLLSSNYLRHSASPPAPPQPLPPYILTFTPPPTYTCGRRELPSLSLSQISSLTATGAVFHPSLRGGQTTYHGPGQVVAYPIISLSSYSSTSSTTSSTTIKPATYVNILEESLISTCLKFGVRAKRTENPGIWITPEEKIGSIGVHLRRNISSHGVSLNFNEEVKQWFDRIIMCGLPGKRAVSLVGVGAKGLSGMDRENKRDGKGGKEGKGDGEVEILEEVANVLVKELAGLLKGVEGVKRIEEQDVLALDVDGSGKEAFEDEQRRLQEMVRRDV